MRKLTKASLSELAKSKEIISFREQRCYVGGGNGTRHAPYSIEEFNALIGNSSWNGGWMQDNEKDIPVYIGGTLTKTDEAYNGGTNFSGGTQYTGGSNSNVPYDGKTQYAGGSNGDSPYNGKTRYAGGTLDDKDKSHELDEVVVIGHRPSNPNPAFGFNSMYLNYNYNYDYNYGDDYYFTGSTHSIPSNNSNYAPRETYVTNAGGGGHTSGSNSSLGGGPKANTGPKLSSERFYAMEKYMDPFLFALIKKEWVKGNLRVNTNPKYNNPAYYDTVANKFFIHKNPNFIPNNYVMAHEYTHFLQDKKGMLPVNAVDGNLNREMQADVMAAIFGVRYSRDFNQITWMSTETKEEILNELNIIENKDTNKKDIFVTQKLWNKLHDKNFILKLQSEWRTYYEARPNTPEVYLEGEQENWDYKWDYFFKELNIKKE
nr:hypothetical protein [uncultured Prevotella sp.]